MRDIENIYTVQKRPEPRLLQKTLMGLFIICLQGLDDSSASVLCSSGIACINAAWCNCNLFIHLPCKCNILATSGLLSSIVMDK